MTVRLSPALVTDAEPEPLMYPDLLAEYDGYAHFKPFRNRNIYACNTHRNNIFEETAFHPEKLLRELVALFHPILLPEYKTLYYEKMR